MESISRELTSAESGAEDPLAGDEISWGEFPDVEKHFFGDIKQYVEQNPQSKETQLFSFLALMNSYIPESYLLKSECQTVLGPPDPIHRGSTFEERMKPFTAVIDTSTNPEHVRIDPLFADKALVVVTNLQITRSTTVKDLMFQLCGDQAQEDTVQFVKDLLTKREMGEHGYSETFSRLIQDIQKNENVFNAISVLKKASNTMTQYPIFPQTLARLYYIRPQGPQLEVPSGACLQSQLQARKGNNEKAEMWAKIAIRRAPSSSYMAYTLAQVYRNRLLESTELPRREIIAMTKEAFRAFKDVEKKAEAEDSEEMNDSMNIRGRLGFMQVAKISFENIQRTGFGLQTHIQLHKWKVEDKFSFFERYLTYSSPSKGSLEQPYFWNNVALCYQHYTEKKVTDSTRFPGLLDFLNHGQFTSRGRRAGLEEHAKTVSDLEAVCDRLKTIYAENNDVETAQQYILSNIILSNKTQNSSLKVAPVRELQEILQEFLGSEDVHGNPEFYLLVLMLFWPEDPERVAEVEGEEEVEELGPEEDPAQLSLGIASELPEHVAFMEQAFEGAGYARYFRGRYLLPLFFLGKGSGLNKWIHKSTLDAIVGEKVDAELANNPDGNSKKKWKRIFDYWSSGKVWQIPEIQEILLPVEVEPTTSESQGEEKWVVRVGGLKIPATAEFESDNPALRFYLGLTIKGPVIFKVDSLDVLGQ